MDGLLSYKLPWSLLPRWAKNKYLLNDEQHAKIPSSAQFINRQYSVILLLSNKGPDQNVHVDQGLCCQNMANEVFLCIEYQIIRWDNNLQFSVLFLQYFVISES